MTIDIVISFDPVSQKVEVTAPMQAKMLCYGILEEARQQIQAFAVPAVVHPSSTDILSFTRKS